MPLKWHRANDGYVNGCASGWSYQMLMGSVWCCSGVVLPAQSPLHFPHIGMLIHVFVPQGLVLCSSLVFFIHFPIPLFHILLMFWLRTQLPQYLFWQQLQLHCLKFFFQGSLVWPHQLSVPDIQPHVLLFEPLLSNDHIMLTQVEDQERLVKESSSSHDEMHFDGVGYLWSFWSTKPFSLGRLFKSFSMNVVEPCQLNGFFSVHEKVSIHSSVC